MSRQKRFRIGEKGFMNSLDLARWQFAITTVYHFLFVPITIGMGFIQGHSDKSNRLASCYISEVAFTHQRKETLMSIQAYILIQTEVGKASSVAKAVSAIAGVSLAEGVTGPYDVIMRAEAPSMEDFGRLILSKVQGVAGITRTLTCPVTYQ